MNPKIYQKFFLPAMLLIIFVGLNISGCNKKSEVSEEITGAGLTTEEEAGPAAEGREVSCAATGVVGPQGTEISPEVQKTPYPYSYGSVHTVYVNAVSFSGDLMTAAVGSWVGVFKGGGQIGGPVNLKGGQVLAEKLVERDGAVFLIVGTMSNLQVCTVNDSTGVEADSCKVFDRVGGISGVDVGGNNIYFTTLAGDFGSIGLDMMQSQSGCVRLYYLASDHPSANTNTNFRAFRVAAGNKVVFATRNNSGSAAFTLNEFIANFMDWIDLNFLRVLDRETRLYSLNPANGKLTQLSLNDPAYQYHVDDLVVGPEGKVFASFWAPRVEDIELLRSCKATPPPTPCGPLTPHADFDIAAAAYFLNSKSGILALDGNNVTSHEVLPFANYNASNGCSAEGLGQWVSTFPAWPPPVCARIPNFGLYFFNRLSSAGDSVYMRGITGYLRLQGDNLEEKSAGNLPPPAGDPGAGIPLAFTANISQSAATGVFGNAALMGYAMESATYGGTPMNLVPTGSLNIYSDPSKLDMDLIGGGGHYAYVDWDKETRAIDVLDPAQVVDFSRNYTDSTTGNPTQLPYREGYVGAQEDPADPGKDRFMTWNPKYDNVNPSHSQSNVAFYESDDPNPKWVSTMDAPDIDSMNEVERPVILHGDFAFGVQNVRDSSNNETHRFGASYVDWAQKKEVFVTYSYIPDIPNGSRGFIGIDQTGDDYTIYLLDYAFNVIVISLHHNADNYYNHPNDPAYAQINFFDPPDQNNPYLTVSHPNAVGAWAGGGKIYFLDQDGNLQVYGADGGFLKTIPNAIPLKQDEKVGAAISTAYINGKLFTTVLILHGPAALIPNSVHFNFNVIDVDQESNFLSYDFNYFLLHAAGDKLYAGSYFNGSDVFDMSITPQPSDFQGTSIKVVGVTP